MDRVIKRGDIFLATFNNEIGSEQYGRRPVIVIQNDIGNKYSPTVIVAKITSKLQKHKIPTHVRIKEHCMVTGSMILLEQIETLDKTRLEKFIGHVNEHTLKKVDHAIDISVKNIFIK